MDAAMARQDMVKRSRATSGMATDKKIVLATTSRA
jgi:hypothetical protein